MKKTKQVAFSFELLPKDRSLTIRMSAQLLKAIKKEAKKRGIDYQKFIRISIEEYLD